jgi:ATP-dependent Clp protease protease subunit
LNTIISERDAEGHEVSYDIFSKLMENRVLFITGYISDETASDIVATMLYLDCVEKRKISLYINSEGGDIRNIFMIYDMMKLLSSPIETVCIGSAECESALLLAAGTKGMRFATKNSVICLNQLLSNSPSQADMTIAETLLKENKNNNNKFVKELSKNIKKSVKILKKDIEREKYFTSIAAKKYGIIDDIVGSIK